MGGIGATGEALAVEEARLAGAAAAGDASAFASLYERYEQRAYNLAYRIAGSEPDAADATQEAFLRAMRRPSGPEPAFRSHLFSATRNACYDLIEKRPPAQAGDEMSEPATPGEMGEEEIRAANMRLPEHQREALALRGLEELSYEEIAAIMETNRNSVAQLVSRARINLGDELHGTMLATVAAPSPECERALPLIAAREDGQLEAGSDDDAWLDAHLAGCRRCRLGVETMREAGASYRAWAPIAVVPWLFKGTMAKAAALAGAGWSEEALSRADSPSPAAMPTAYLDGGDDEGRPTRRRRALAAAGLVALLLGGGIATVLAGGRPSSSTSDRPVADTHPARTATASKPRNKRHRHPRPPRTEATPRGTTAASPAPANEAGGSASSESAAAPSDHPTTSGLQPPQVAAIPESKSKPKPGPTPQSAATPTAPAEAQPPTEATTEAPSQEHPGKGKGPPAGVPASGGR